MMALLVACEQFSVEGELHTDVRGGDPQRAKV